MSRNSQSRKWLITIEDPFNKCASDGELYTRDMILENAKSLKPLVYFCAAEEVGGKTGKHHIHIFLAFSSGVRFTTIQRLYPGGHYDNAVGTCSENRDYISKSGKWEKDNKHGTKIPGTFEEWGECPIDRRGGRSDLADIVDMIQDGASNAEIRAEYTGEYFLHHDKIERIRQELRQEEAAGEYRKLDVTYIYGATGVGKTRLVNDTYGASAFRITDYSHPFDGYRGEDVMVFDEFYSQIQISNMLNYLDGYRVELPARYSNKIALYKKVYIISNHALSDQYKGVQESDQMLWNAFTRRINNVVHFYAKNKRLGIKTEDYLKGSTNWIELPL